MVAISLYRGNLHRVPGAPRQWPMPRRAISSRHFRELLRRRSQALAAAEGGEKEEEGEGRGKEEEERIGDSSVAKPEPSQPDRVENVEPQLAESKLEIKELKSMIKEEGEGEPLREPKRTDDASASNPPVAASAVVESTGGGAADVKLEMSNNLITVSDKEERKRELEKKLHVLNEKKHILVQMLKQVASLVDLPLGGSDYSNNNVTNMSISLRQGGLSMSSQLGIFEVVYEGGKADRTRSSINKKKTPFS